ncbi:hypothetical protein B0I35DRAFT_79459 [Stachybotrys elegans]|uniref:Uncharacterized protein n=1 Tax=Stachybotrys elegans TaxID=80388 RepID=A0A8K0SNW2_9HYPO|nr:hypothetical protein B0I35DRAFT_79459 [Stachybotrys elegans]
MPDGAAEGGRRGRSREGSRGRSRGGIAGGPRGGTRGESGRESRGGNRGRGRGRESGCAPEAARVRFARDAPVALIAKASTDALSLVGGSWCCACVALRRARVPLTFVGCLRGRGNFWKFGQLANKHHHFSPLFTFHFFFHLSHVNRTHLYFLYATPSAMENSLLRDVRTAMQKRAAMIMLRSTLPQGTPARLVGDNPSGLDCLIILMRRLFAEVITTPDGFAWLTQLSADPVIAYALTDFTEPQAEAQRSLDKRQALDRIATGYSFRGLAESAFMRSTIWTQPVFQQPLDNYGLLRDWAPGEEAAVGAIAWTAGTLQETIDALFGWRVINGRREFWRSSCPIFMRVCYTASKDRPLPLSQVRHFSVPLFRDAAPTQYYHLIAMVKIGDTDMVRTFHTGGLEMETTSNPSVSSSWSIHDPIDAQYYLVFVAFHLEPNLVATEGPRRRFVETNF